MIISVCTILFSLQFRKAYGGMKGDINMMEYYKQLVINNKIHILDGKIPIIKSDINDLTDREWIYEANDFHCNRYIIRKIQYKYPHLSENYLKDLIWIFSSSINYRINNWLEVLKSNNLCLDFLSKLHLFFLPN